jgi:glycerol-3-phosphate cytidylyltransferase
MTTTGYVPGGFDLFHIGHLNILRAAAERCDRLIVGVATDESLVAMKGRPPVVPFAERLDIVSSLRIVDLAVADHAQDKRVAYRDHPFDILFKGDDWKGTVKGSLLEMEMGEVGARVVYFPYTERTSSSMLREFLRVTLGESGS